jgi:hypothetical protein
MVFKTALTKKRQADILDHAKALHPTSSVCKKVHFIRFRLDLQHDQSYCRRNEISEPLYRLGTHKQYQMQLSKASE